MTNNLIFQKIESFLNKKIISTSSVGGGCIANSQIIHTESGQRFFLKSGVHQPNIFRNEANGLKELSKPACIKVPQIILQDDDFLLLEHIEEGGRPANFFSIFGQQLATMNQFTSEKIGFYENNYIGATPQINMASKSEAENWPLFYFNKRLLFQYKLAEKNGYATDKLKKGFLLLENKFDEILAGSEEPPALIHGDLWSGNFLCDSGGNPVLIDPAVYYGHREAELAMTKLFGGFSSEFYHAYNETYSLPDRHDFRENIYFLYHVLNHLNLFGRSYYNQTINLLWFYL